MIPFLTARRAQRPSAWVDVLHRWLWLGYGSVGLIAVAVYFLLPSVAAQDLFTVGFGLTSAAMIAVGVRWYRPARPCAWYCVALGVGLTAGGDALWTFHEIVLRDAVPFPSLADVLYLLAYPCFGTGLYLLMRTRGPDRQWTQWLDAVIIALGFALVSWVFLIDPYVDNTAISGLALVVSVAYPLMDVLLIVVTAQFIFSTGSRSPAFGFVCLSLGTLVIADTLFTLFTLNGTYSTGHLIDSGWLLSHIGWGMAALHPSMASLHTAEPPHPSQGVLPWPRHVLLTTAVLMAPGMLLLNLALGVHVDVGVVAGASVILFLCVQLRLQGVVRMLSGALGKVQHQAFHDALTGLANRALFLDRLEHACMRADRQHSHLAVLFLDLDRFKIVNDSLGHAVGDSLLVALAARLSSCIRAQDTLARMSGDEFTILIEDVQTIGAAVAVAERIMAALEPPIVIGRHPIAARVSMGLVLHTPGVDQPADLLRYADMAMYQAKTTGKAHYEVFVRSMNAVALERMTLEQDLRLALAQHEFQVHYQPIADLQTRRMTGVEALVRWEHPTRGRVLPADFIPLAEESGLIIPMGRWVLEDACRQVQGWHQAHPAAALLNLNVNLSARQFQSPTLIADVAHVLAVTGLPPGCLTLEITETVVMDQADATIETLQALRGVGVKLAIDDFGTGYSSLSYLHRFAVDCLKIDRSFVHAMRRDTEACAIVRGIISLAHTLGLSVTAEGVETADEAAILETLGSECAQGYFFHRPSAWSSIAELLADGVDAPVAAGTRRVASTASG